MKPLLNWQGKGDGLAKLLDNAGIEISWVDSVLMCSDPDLAAQIAASFDAVAYELPHAIARVNQEAYDRIVAIMPPYKQNNNMALGLQNTMAFGADPAKWPADQQAILQTVNAQWAQIKAIRDASNIINANLATKTDWTELYAYDPKADQTWPK